VPELPCLPGVTPPVPAFARTHVPATWADLPGWSDDDVAAAWPAFLLSCRGVASRANGNGWKRVCDLARAADGKPGFDAAVSSSRTSRPTPSPTATVRSMAWSPAITSPCCAAAGCGPKARAAGAWRAGRPADHRPVGSVPGAEGQARARPAGGQQGAALLVAGRNHAKGDKLPGKTLLYVDDAVELFFLQVQGSGRVRLADGSTVRLNYADQNGHPYQSIGKALVERGELKLEEASMQGIQSWARANPARWTRCSTATRATSSSARCRTAMAGRSARWACR
jgi:membrane-bound lytic murein transglycosylase A